MLYFLPGKHRVPPPQGLSEETQREPKRCSFLPPLYLSELAAFKCFFWLKSVNPAPAFTGEQKRPPDKPNSKGASYQAYINEVIFGDNSILVELNGNKVVYLNHGNYHYIMTRDERFCRFTYNHYQNIIKRSTPISSANEKDRKRFFNRVRERIVKRMQTVV